MSFPKIKSFCEEVKGPAMFTAGVAAVGWLAGHAVKYLRPGTAFTPFNTSVGAVAALSATVFCLWGEVVLLHAIFGPPKEGSLRDNGLTALLFGTSLSFCAFTAYQVPKFLAASSKEVQAVAAGVAFSLALASATFLNYARKKIASEGI